MGLDKKSRSIALNNLLETVSSISNKDYQVRTWINGMGPECDDFIETTIFFNDYCDRVISKYKDYGVSDRQYFSILKFKKIYEDFSDDHYSEEDFIDSPEWAYVMNEAKKLLQEFSKDS